MKRKKIRSKIYKFFPFILPPLIVGTVVFNFFFLRKFEEHKQNALAIKFEPRPQEHELVSDDPKAYHFIKTEVDPNSGLDLAVVIPRFQGVAITAEEHQKKIRLLERQIKLAQRQTRAKPNDLKAKENLRALYMLRLTLLNLSSER